MGRAMVRNGGNGHGRPDDFYWEQICDGARRFLAGEPLIDQGEWLRLLAGAASRGHEVARRELLKLLAEMDAGTKQ
jgi:hypothetical protein